MSCHCHTEIVRDGSGQLDRYLKALDPAYAPMDERSIEDLLVYAKRYASQIRFYDIPNSNVSDNAAIGKVSWREFFRRDMAVVAASVSITDFTQVKKDYDETRQQLEIHPDAEIYAALFKPIVGMAARLDSWYSVAIPENPLYADLLLGINSDLKAQLQKVREYEEGFKLVDPSNPLTIDYSAIKNKQVWGLDEIVKAEITIYEGVDESTKIRNAALYVDDVFLAFYSFLTQLVDQSHKYVTFALEQYPSHQPHMALFIAFLKLFRHAQDQMNEITGRMLNYYYRDVLQLTEKPSVPDKVHVVFELAKGVAEYNIEEGTDLLAGKDAGGIAQHYTTSAGLVVNQAKVKELKTIFIQKTSEILENGEEHRLFSSIYARPVANSMDGFGAPFENTHPSWPTFGQATNLNREPKNICERLDLLSDKLNHKNDTSIGFAIASPQLLVQGGKRLVSFRFYGLSRVLTNDLLGERGSFHLLLSAEDGWLRVDTQMTEAYFKEFSATLQNGVFPSFEGRSSYYFDADNDTILLYLPMGEKPIVPFNAEIHQGTFKTQHPVVQFMMGPLVSIDLDLYRQVRQEVLGIEVRVGSMHLDDDGEPFLDGLKTLVVKNDDGIIDTSKSFDPYTSYPSTGKSLYIGSDEIFNKPVDQLSLNIVLADTALDIPDVVVNNAIVHILDNRQWRPVTDEKRLDDLNLNFLTQTLNRLPITYNTDYNATTLKGFLRVKLDVDFSDSSNGIFELMQRLALSLKSSELSISYHAGLYAMEEGVDQFFHVYPFGVLEANPRMRYAGQIPDYYQDLMYAGATDPERVDTKFTLYPQFTYLDPYAKYSSEESVRDNEAEASAYETNLSVHPLRDRSHASRAQTIDQLMLDASGLLDRVEGYANQYSGWIQEEGLLFIGLENLKPLQTLSLLFQFAEGSADDEDNDPPAIHWSYLVSNSWRPLKGESIISDSTYGFQTTGIVKIDVPADITNSNTVITSGLYWFCASVTEYANRIPRLIDVVTQAVEASFVDQNNDQRHFNEALPAGSITKMQVKVAEVSKVLQPFASWNGKPRETGQIFYTRVSERLRHKNRAINAWDYEHLVLDRFKDIYKVKAITHTDPNCLCRHPEDVIDAEGEMCCGEQVSPGHVLIVPIANLKNRHGVNPLQPKTSRRTLLEIQEYLKGRTSPFVKVHAKNPLYEEVIVFFRVKFYSGVDKGYFLKKLNEEIVQYLTPWAFDEHADVKFGDKIYASSVINFIEERPYVDFITDFLMGVCKDTCCAEERPKPQPAPSPFPADEQGPAPEADNIRTSVRGVVLDSSSGEPLPGVQVMVRGTEHSFTTDVQGRFAFNNVLSAPATLNFALIGFDEKSVESALNVEWKIYLHKRETKERDKDGEVVALVSNLCGCNDFERLVQDETERRGVVVAVPSTSRSILVSASRHIIVPYEEPPKSDPCNAKDPRIAQRVIDTSKSPEDINRSHGVPKRSSEIKKSDQESKTKGKSKAGTSKKRSPRKKK